MVLYQIKHQQISQVLLSVNAHNLQQEHAAKTEHALMVSDKQPAMELGRRILHAQVCRAIRSANHRMSSAVKTETAQLNHQINVGAVRLMIVRNVPVVLVQTL